MGFGSYDESEQRDDSEEFDEDDGVAVHENDHSGTVEFDSDESNAELIDRLQDMKDDGDDEDDD